MNQTEENICYSKLDNTNTNDRITMDKSLASTSRNDPTKNHHSIEKTTKMLSSPTDWNAILSKDLDVSESDSDSPRISTVATNTEIQRNPAKSTEVNTSPLCIVDMGQPSEPSMASETKGNEGILNH